MPTPTSSQFLSLDAEIAEAVKVRAETATQVARFFVEAHAFMQSALPSITDHAARNSLVRQLLDAHRAITDGTFDNKFDPKGVRAAQNRSPPKDQPEKRGPQPRSFMPQPATPPLNDALQDTHVYVPRNTPTNTRIRLYPSEGSPLNHAAPTDVTRVLNNIPSIKDTVLRVHPMKVGFAIDPVVAADNGPLIKLAKNRDAIMSALSAELRVVPPSHGYIVSRIPKEMFCPETGCITATTETAVARIAKDETGVQPTQVLWSKHYDPEVDSTITAVISLPEAVRCFHILNSAPSRAQQLRCSVNRCDICHDYAHPTRYCRRVPMCNSCGLHAHAGDCVSPTRCVNCLSLEHSTDYEKCPLRPVIVRGGVFSPSTEERRRVRRANRRSNKKSASNEKQDELAAVIANASAPIPGFIPAPSPSEPSSSVAAGEARGFAQRPSGSSADRTTDCVIVSSSLDDCDMGGTAPSRRL
ncbi:hypothetical protein BROUX41_002549 [Berkeleyomyces rouxiae]|uniref:uncharacterized protein n=1 Tax=Berkeleyomyces rouxiae TaxID=2035830 RepID=UPI003B7853A4